MLLSYISSKPACAIPEPPDPAPGGPLPANANFADICHLLGIQNQIPNQHDEHGFTRWRVRCGQHILTADQPCDRIFVVNSGFLKSSVTSHGKKQVIGFPMRGDLLGIDGLVDRHYHLEVAALSDATLIEIPLDTLSSLGRLHSEFPMAMCDLMSRSLAREQALIGIRSGLGTQARMAYFLLDMAERNAAAGYAANSFSLVMPRAAISNYLGMAIETVSRMLSELQTRDLITISGRNVVINAPDALRALSRSPRRRGRSQADPALN
jgi:CRP/FNR family transcriptional regulator